MTKITTSSKFSEVSGAILNLNGVVTIKDIVDAILQINNFQQDTLDKIKKKNSMELYGTYQFAFHEYLDNLKVDMTYQRRVRLRQLLNKLTDGKGFNSHGAGAIDVAMRGKDAFVWDGLRRSILAGIAGCDYIPVFRYTHDRLDSVTAMQQKEAKFFKMRNADTETMKPEEIFKSKVVYNDPMAIRILDVIKDANLDVEGLNSGYTVMHGFRELENKLFSKVQSDEVVRASKIIRSVFSKENVVSSYLLIGLALLLQKNDELDGPLTDSEIESQLTTWVNADEDRTQSTLTKKRLNGKPSESIAWTISQRAVNFNGQQEDLITKLKLQPDDTEILEDM